MAFMNDNISQVFAHYIENFVKLNDDEHEEYYKWQVCYEFPELMDNALAASDEDFATELMKARNCTRNIIDSYTQPFAGLVELAKREPAAVKQMLKDLYAPDGGDIDKQMQQIEAFFDSCNTLLDTYFPGTFLYKPNSHSVSAMLFLYDPDHHYMYKATECKDMADCIGFYDSWGSGDNIKLDVFYRMCDEMLERVKECPELIATDESRFDPAFKKLRDIPLHPDSEKHILLFDMIYCCYAYDLLNTIPFQKPNTKEKKLYIENRKKAEGLLEEYRVAASNFSKLQEAMDYIQSVIKEGGTVRHKKYGDCDVKEVNIAEGKNRLTIDVPGKEEPTVLGLAVVLANGIVTVDVEGFAEKIGEYRNVLKDADGICRRLKFAESALKPYEEYL